MRGECDTNARALAGRRHGLAQRKHDRYSDFTAPQMRFRTGVSVTFQDTVYETSEWSMRPLSVTPSAALTSFSKAIRHCPRTALAGAGARRGEIPEREGHCTALVRRIDRRCHAAGDEETPIDGAHDVRPRAPTIAQMVACA